MCKVKYLPENGNDNYHSQHLVVVVVQQPREAIRMFMFALCNEYVTDLSPGGHTLFKTLSCALRSRQSKYNMI